MQRALSTAARQSSRRRRVPSRLAADMLSDTVLPVRHGGVKTSPGGRQSTKNGRRWHKGVKIKRPLTRASPAHYLTGTRTRYTVKRRDGEETRPKPQTARATLTSCVGRHDDAETTALQTVRRSHVVGRDEGSCKRRGGVSRPLSTRDGGRLEEFQVSSMFIHCTDRGRDGAIAWISLPV